VFRCFGRQSLDLKLCGNDSIYVAMTSHLARGRASPKFGFTLFRRCNCRRRLRNLRSFVGISAARSPEYCVMPVFHRWDTFGGAYCVFVSPSRGTANNCWSAASGLFGFPKGLWTSQYTPQHSHIFMSHWSKLPFHALRAYTPRLCSRISRALR